VQKLFATNLGTRILPVAINGSAENNQKRLYASASLQEKTSEVILKAVNATGSTRAVEISLEGVRGSNGRARLITLSSQDLKAENTLDEPQHVSPTARDIEISSPKVHLDLGPNSVTVLRLPYAP